MRCPVCSSLDDRVVDSRQSDDGVTVRRRRECLTCGRRFTTYERIEEVPLVVQKRSGERQAFDRSKVVAGVKAAAKNRPVSEEDLEALAADVEEEVRLIGAEVSTAQVGQAVLARLARLDQVAYMRFASVYKDFESPGDFAQELERLQAEVDAEQT